MKTYWDSSALLELLHDDKLRSRLQPESNGTRPHSLAEMFSILTKGVVYNYPAEDAAKLISALAEELEFVELTKSDALSAVKDARRLGVRGARIHDLMHAAAARKFEAELLMTLDRAGFEGITGGIEVRSP